MTFSDILTWAAAAYWVVAMGLLVISVVGTILQPRIAARRATRRDQPPVSIVLPVKLLEDGFDRTQESAFAQAYPSFDVTVSSAEAESPAVRRMREIFARHPERPSRVLLSTARFAASPKVDNLFAPFMQAQNDVILMKDANVLLEPDALAQHMRQLTDEVGLVCAIPYCAGLENFAAHVEAAIINGPHARMLFLASCLGQGHGVGKIMLFRRSDFLRAGGFDAISHTVGEDNALAKAMRRDRAAAGLFAPACTAKAGRARLWGCLSQAIALERDPPQRRASVFPAGADLPGFSGGYRRISGRAAPWRLSRRRLCGDLSGLVCAGDIAFRGQRMAVIGSGASGFYCPRGYDDRGLGERLDDRPGGLGEGQGPCARRGAAGAPAQEEG
ncbi:glycosyltransferase [Methylocystis sp. IM2]|uniref:glycosyltransferase n=1 Tax=Methylocystis sp. IM2 TaxID=3136563 RepID=UPI0030F5D2A9